MITDRVLFIDGEALVLDKPAGLPVDRPRDRSPSIEAMLDELTFGFQRAPQPVHRLDRDTSGCLLLARNPKAAKRYQQAFESGLVEKQYLAVLAGVPAVAEGMVDLALAKVSSREAGWRIVPSPKGKPARTHWRTLQIVDGRALVALRPETGRTHQIRVHAQAGIGVPVAGDPVYGSAMPDIPMLLHAYRLAMPRGSKPAVDVIAPIPERFAALGFRLAERDILPESWG